jgi:hypothetical protein
MERTYAIHWGTQRFGPYPTYETALERATAFLQRSTTPVTIFESIAIVRSQAQPIVVEVIK